MYKPTDPNSYTEYFDVFRKDKNLNPVLIGSLRVDFIVDKYDRVKVKNFSSSEVKKTQTYLLKCVQYLTLYNPDGIIKGTNRNLQEYSDYLVLLKSSVKILSSNNKSYTNPVNKRVLHFSPQVANTKVTTTGSTGSSDGTNTGISSSSTVGSSTAKTNGYTVNVSAGFQGESATGSAGYSHEHSTTNTNSHSKTNETSESNDHSTSSSGSHSMSIKDWGIYGIFNPNENCPSWIFGQEYPFSVTDFHRTDINTANPNNKFQNKLSLPKHVLNNLFDGTCLLPPSQLSNFGLSFLTKSQWLVEINNSELLLSTIIENDLTYLTASHSILESGSHVSVYMQNQTTEFRSDETMSADFSSSIVLPLLALEPIGKKHPTGIVGFIANKFQVTPDKGDFVISSDSNTLLVSQQSDTKLICQDNFLQFVLNDKSDHSFKINFKVVDSYNNFKLILKHWIDGDMDSESNNPVSLSIKVNNQHVTTKYVTSRWGDGGENNLCEIYLRELDFASNDYCDYINLGLNEIEVIVSCNAGSTGPTYCLQALSVETV